MRTTHDNDLVAEPTNSLSHLGGGFNVSLACEITMKQHFLVALVALVPTPLIYSVVGRVWNKGVSCELVSAAWTIDNVVG